MFAVVCGLGVVCMIAENFATVGGFVMLLQVTLIVMLAAVGGILAAALFPKRRIR